MDPFEESRVKKRHVRLLNKLKKGSKFTLKELETLLLIHFQMKEHDLFDRRRFKAFIHHALGMTDRDMSDKTFVCFDSRNKNWISIKDFVLGLGIVLRGSQKEQADFSFTVYDRLGDGKLTRDSMYFLLRNCIARTASADDAEEFAKDLVETLFKLVDQDKDGIISNEEFREAVRQEPLLLEALGPCFPERPARDAFLTAFAQKPPIY